jgi:hypothetical protein
MRTQFLSGFNAQGAWWAAMWVAMAAMAGCTYESSSLSGVLCEDEGKREGARVCRNGVWVQESGEDLPISDLPDEGDMLVDQPDEGDMLVDQPDEGDMSVDQPDESDMSVDQPDEGDMLVDQPDEGDMLVDQPDEGDMSVDQSDEGDLAPDMDMCISEDDDEFCARAPVATCGSKTDVDNCGQQRTVMSCGVCMNGQVCGAVTDNTCGDVVITAQMPDPNTNDVFGLSLALKGDYLIVGKPDADVNGAIDKGAAHVYKRNPMTNRWSWSQTLSPEDHPDVTQRGGAGDYFGWAVAFDGTTLVVGAPEYNVSQNTHNGKGYVFTYTLDNMGQFVFQQKLAPNADGVSNTSGEARFGWSVAVDGATMVVGAPRDDDGGGRNEAGSIYILGRSGNTWSQTEGRLRVISLRGSDMTFGNAGGDEYGYSVAISGDTIVAGAPFRDTSGAVDGGIVVILQRTNGTWARVRVFDPAERSRNAHLGASVAVQGARAVFGAPGANTMVSGSGAAYVVETPLMMGGMVTRLVASNAASDDHFGFGVSLTNNRLVVGANRRDISGRTDAGTAYLFDFAAGMWTEREQQAPAGSSAADDRFGYAVAIDGNRIAIGAPWRDSNGQTDSGAVFIFEY